MLGADEAPPTGFESVFAPALTGEWEDLTAARTLVIKLRIDALKAIGNKIQLRIAAPQTGSLTLSKSYIGPASASGHAWNFSSASQFLFGGLAAMTADVGGIVESDELAFDFDGAKALCLAFELPSGARQLYARNLGPEVIAYYKDGVSEAADLDKEPGYTPLVGFCFNVAELAAAPA